MNRLKLKDCCTIKSPDERLTEDCYLEYTRNSGKLTRRNGNPTKKWAKHMNRPEMEGEIKMTTKNIKKLSAFLLCKQRNTE